MRRERGLPNLPPGTASVPPLLNRMLTRTELWCVNMCFVRFRHLPNIQARRVKLKFLQSWRLFFVKKNCSQTVLFARGRPIRIIQIICNKNCKICTKLAPALSPGFQTHAHDAQAPRQNHINVNSHLSHRHTEIWEMKRNIIVSTNYCQQGTKCPHIISCWAQNADMAQLHSSMLREGPCRPLPAPSLVSLAAFEITCANFRESLKINSTLRKSLFK